LAKAYSIKLQPLNHGIFPSSLKYVCSTEELTHFFPFLEVKKQHNKMITKRMNF